MDASPNEAPLGFWSLYGSPTVYAMDFQTEQSTMSKPGTIFRPIYIEYVYRKLFNMPNTKRSPRDTNPTYHRYLQIGIAVGLVGAEILTS